MSISRRDLVVLGASVAAFGCGRQDPEQDRFTVWGPPAGPSIVLAYAHAQGWLQQAVGDAAIRAWRNPDELRAGLTSRTIRLSIMPLNTAANLYNRGQDVRLLNIMTRGLLYILSRDENLSSIESLAGKRLAVPFRKDAPDIVLRRLLAHHKINPDTDLTLRTTGTPIEAGQLLLTGQVDAAFVPEPAASAAIAAGGAIGMRIRRAIDLQDAWAAMAAAKPSKDASLPQAGLAVLGSFYGSHAHELSRLNEALARAAHETIRNPGAAAEAAASLLGLPKKVLEASIPFSNLTAVPAHEAKGEVERYFAAIHELDSEILGGRLPDARFYL